MEGIETFIISRLFWTSSVYSRAAALARSHCVPCHTITTHVTSFTSSASTTAVVGRYLRPSTLTVLEYLITRTRAVFCTTSTTREKCFRKTLVDDPAIGPCEGVVSVVCEEREVCESSESCWVCR